MHQYSFCCPKILVRIQIERILEMVQFDIDIDKLKWSSVGLTYVAAWD